MNESGSAGLGTPERSVSHHAAWSIVVRGIAEVLARLSTLAWMVFAVRMLTPDEFGAVSYALSIMLLVSAIPSWGFDTGLTRKGSVEPERLPELYGQVLLVKTVLGVVVFLVAGLVFSGWGLGRTNTLVLSVLLACGLPEAWSHSARAASVARQSPLGMSIALIIQRLLIAVFVVIALLAGMREEGVAAGVLAGTLVGWCAHVIALHRLGIRLREVSWKQRDRREALRGTFLIGLSAVTYAALFRVDAVLLGLLKGSEAVAVYAVAYRLIETVLFVSHVINQAIFPVMSASTTAGRIQRGYEKALAAAAFVYFPFAVVSVIEGPRILGLLFGESYASTSSSVLAWLAPSPFLFAAGYFGITVLIARQRNLDLLVAALCATAVNVAANLLLIPRFAADGAALANSGAYAVQLAVVYVAMRRTDMTVRIGRPLVEVGIATAVLAGSLIVLDAPLVVEMILGAAVYMGVWFVLARRFAPDQTALAGQLLGVASRRKGA